MIHVLQAVVLWSRRSREADKVFGIYTDKLGRLTVRATSAARPTAKFASLTEPFVESEMAIYLKPGQGWGKMVGGRLRRSFPRLRTDLSRSTAAAWACEVVHRLTPEESDSPEKFTLLTGTLEALENATHLAGIRLGFALRFLNLAGLGLDNKDPWQAVQRDHPEWAESLMQASMLELGETVFQGPAIKALEQLAGQVVNDHLTHPLRVNRFRQMTGVEV